MLSTQESNRADMFEDHVQKNCHGMGAISLTVCNLGPDLMHRIRQEEAVPVMDMLCVWMIAQRDLVPEGSANQLETLAVLSRYLVYGAVPIDNKGAEN